MLSSDEEAFGGFENLSKKHNTEFDSTAGDYDKRPHSLQVIISLPIEIDAFGLISLASHHRYLLCCNIPLADCTT